MNDVVTLEAVSGSLRRLIVSPRMSNERPLLEASRKIIDRKLEREGNSAICRECGCTEFDPCIGAFGDCCSWAEPGLCSDCVKTDPDEARV